MSESTETTVVVATAEPRLAAPRLPYHRAFEERFGIDRGTWKVLTDVIFPAAEAPESIVMALSYCKARGLDILKKPVHIVPVWDKKRGKMVDSVWPAISESRITAMRTNAYAGKDPTVFGPETTETLGGVQVTYPEWAQVTVYRLLHGVRCAFTGEQIRWKEYYATAKRDTEAPNDMWRKKAYSQASKCAEASALRTAFPEEVGNEATSDEMEGQEVSSTAILEPITGSGVMARLSGNQEGAGFAHDGSINETDAPALPSPDPVDSGPKKRTTRKAAEVEQRPTETASVQSVEAGQGSSESATPASTASQAPADSEPPAEVTEQRQAPKDVVTQGYPEADEIYHLTGDDWHYDIQTDIFVRDAYQNGEPHGRVGSTANLSIYEDHAPEGGGQLEEEDETQQLPEELQAYIDTIENIPSFVEAKKAMVAFFATQTFKDMGLPQKNQIRRNTDEALVEGQQAGRIKDLPDQADDVSRFRLWIETQDDPDAIDGTLGVLMRSASFAAAKVETQNVIREAAQARSAWLRE